MEHLDKQMQLWSTRLRDGLKIDASDSNQLASVIARQVSALPNDVKDEIRGGAPVGLQDRLDELIAFQTWMDLAHDSRHPAVTRAQVIVQNYVCFVYLNESCFRVLKNHFPSGTAGKKCCKFLIDNPVRAFRNAMAHANWRYKDDFSGIEFWARKGHEPDESMSKWEVSQQDLNFWQSLARCVSYAAFTSL